MGKPRYICIVASLFLLWMVLSFRDSEAVDRTVTFHNSKGKATCTFTVELARTPKEHERGLMFRKQLGPKAGMLFIFDADNIRSFWMKNTFIPLDMIFIDSELRVVDFYESAKPMNETPIVSRAPARYVLEVNAGKSVACVVKRGEKVTFTNISR